MRDKYGVLSNGSLRINISMSLTSYHWRYTFPEYYDEVLSARRVFRGLGGMGTKEE
jgi:hypothetical protein